MQIGANLIGVASQWFKVFLNKELVVRPSDSGHVIQYLANFIVDTE